MNTSEQIYHIEETLRYLTDKLDREIRIIKNMLIRIIDYVRPEETEL
tara:strand:+ start:45 stop:185 length:141 start_codon:yes stop_codon:yes gene_type:complete